MAAPAWPPMDGQPADESFSLRHVNWLGLFLIVLGVGWLGGLMGWFRFDWRWAGPFALIAVGCGMLFGRQRRRRW
ncbi:MAG: hypothetical protein QOI63_1081 [Thermoplasmata archaeon]|jgi:tellurite resistance protein TehA-like permease|nr:hypothetical protein [Thermoplasmata archaeon]